MQKKKLALLVILGPSNANFGVGLVANYLSNNDDPALILKVFDLLFCYLIIVEEFAITYRTKLRIGKTTDGVLDMGSIIFGRNGFEGWDMRHGR